MKWISIFTASCPHVLLPRLSTYRLSADIPPNNHLGKLHKRLPEQVRRVQRRCHCMPKPNVLPSQSGSCQIVTCMSTPRPTTSKASSSPRGQPGTTDEAGRSRAKSLIDTRCAGNMVHPQLAPRSRRWRASRSAATALPPPSPARGKARKAP